MLPDRAKRRTLTYSLHEKMLQTYLLFRHKPTTDHSKHSTTFTKVAARGVLWDGPWLSTSFRGAENTGFSASSRGHSHTELLGSSVQAIWYDDAHPFTGTFRLKQSPSSVAWMLFIRRVTLHYMFGSVKIQVVLLALGLPGNSDQSVSVSFSFYNSQVWSPFCTKLICSLC